MQTSLRKFTGYLLALADTSSLSSGADALIVSAKAGAALAEWAAPTRPRWQLLWT